MTVPEARLISQASVREMLRKVGLTCYGFDMMIVKPSLLLAYEADRREQNRLLQVLVENEMSRLRVWANPLNETSQGTDHPAWDPLIPAVSDNAVSAALVRSSALHLVLGRMG